MSLGQFVHKSRRWFNRVGPRAIPAIIADGGVSALSHLSAPFLHGTSVYNYEWDVLVILDACRVDMYRDVVGECDTIWSAGGASPEWMVNTFGGRDNRDTAYVTGNPFSRDYDEASFGLLDEVWRYAWDDDLGTVLPKPITDRGIQVARKDDYDRVILHYMQPHYPFIAGDDIVGHIERDSFGAEGDVNEDDIWTQLLLGENDDIESVRQAYWANLEYVFDFVRTVLNNVDGTVAITADHGNALGEFGVWGHPVGAPLPSVRRVPWDVRECTDSESYTPDTYNTSPLEHNVEKQLSDLGYT